MTTAAHKPSAISAVCAFNEDFARLMASVLRVILRLIADGIARFCSSSNSFGSFSLRVDNRFLTTSLGTL